MCVWGGGGGGGGRAEKNWGGLCAVIGLARRISAWPKVSSITACHQGTSAHNPNARD